MPDQKRERRAEIFNLSKAAGITAVIIGLLLIAAAPAALVSGCKPSDQVATGTIDYSSESEKLKGNETEESETAYPSITQTVSETTQVPAQTTTVEQSEPAKHTSTVKQTTTTRQAASEQTTTTRQTTAIEQTTTVKQPATVKVSIPEGFSLVQICMRLDNAGVNSFDQLFASATSDDFSDYAAIREAGFPANRCFQLEGYLFPDTYEFYIDENPKSVWGRFLNNFSAKTESYRSLLSRFGWTMDQAVTFASLLEREAGNENEVSKVSSVMHNRLNSGIKLQLDASIVYVESYIKPFISGDVNRFNSYYNTYKTAALPAGPICNPGQRALNAALNPADTDYYYFANDNAEPPNYYYSTTLEEHQAILDKYNIG